MGFKYLLHTPDGDHLGLFESMRCDWQAGDEFRGDGNVPYRIVSLIPLPRIEEFVKRPTHGLSRLSGCSVAVECLEVLHTVQR